MAESLPKYRPQRSWASSTFSYGQRQVDRVVSPEARQQAYSHVAAFASERPYVAAFVLSQVLFSFFPILIFVTFAASTVAFALGAAVVFSLFWIGVALLFVVPALFVTSSIAVLVYIWSVASFAVARRLYAVLPTGAKAVHEKGVVGENGTKEFN